MKRKGQQGVALMGFPAALSGDYAYLVNGPAGLQVLNVSNPANPQHVGRDVQMTWRSYGADDPSGLIPIDIPPPPGAEGRPT